MTALLFVGVIVAALAALGFAALRWGVDSRLGSTDTRTAAGTLA